MCLQYPKGNDDKANFVSLLSELRIAFEGEASSTGHPRLLLSAAVPAAFKAMHEGSVIKKYFIYKYHMYPHTKKFYENANTTIFNQNRDVIIAETQQLPSIENTSFTYLKFY